MGQFGSGAGGVGADEVVLELGELVVRDFGLREGAEAGVASVVGFAIADGIFEGGSALCDAGAGFWVEGDGCVVSYDALELGWGEGGAGEGDGCVGVGWHWRSVAGRRRAGKRSVAAGVACLVVGGYQAFMKVALQWITAAFAALVAGPVAGWATAAHRGVDGSAHATMLLGASPLVGVLGHLGAMLIAAAVGVATARLLNGRYGLFCAGLVLAWAAARSGRVEQVLTAQGDGGSLTTLTIEGLIVAALTAGLVFVVCRDGTYEKPSRFEKALSAESALGLSAALVAGGIGAWLAAQDDLKGQTIAAAWVAGALGAIFARVLAHRSRGWVVCLGVMLLGVVGPLMASRMGLERFLAGLYSGEASATLANLARVAPLDWAAGVLMGLPVGMTWAGSMVDQRVSDEHPNGASERSTGAA